MLLFLISRFLQVSIAFIECGYIRMSLGVSSFDPTKSVERFRIHPRHVVDAVDWIADILKHEKGSNARQIDRQGERSTISKVEKG